MMHKNARMCTVAGGRLHASQDTSSGSSGGDDYGSRRRGGPVRWLVGAVKLGMVGAATALLAAAVRPTRRRRLSSAIPLHTRHCAMHLVRRNKMRWASGRCHALTPTTL